MSLISEVVVDYLLAQIAAGAQVVQLFDSWVGWLGALRLRAARAAARALRDRQGQGPGGAGDLLRQRRLRACCITWPRPAARSSAWTGASISTAPGSSSDGVAIQGNLDPHHAARPAQGHRGARRRHHQRAPAVAPGTSSTWVTGSSRRPRPTTSSTWSTRCIACPPRPSERPAAAMTESLVDVALLAFGGPGERASRSPTFCSA